MKTAAVSLQQEPEKLISAASEGWAANSVPAPKSNKQQIPIKVNLDEK